MTIYKVHIKQQATKPNIKLMKPYWHRSPIAQTSANMK